jgi:hypothetical protein
MASSKSARRGASATSRLSTSKGRRTAADAEVPAHAHQPQDTPTTASKKKSNLKKADLERMLADMQAKCTALEGMFSILTEQAQADIITRRAT